MSEFEAYQALSMTSDLAMSYSQYLLSALTGYLLIAFFIGASLTRFQVSFVNILFVLLYGSVSGSLAGVIKRVGYFSAKLGDMKSEIPVDTIAFSSANEAGGVTAITISVLLMVGCLVFMWDVRHRKS
jgi:hypothetical protein